MVGDELVDRAPDEEQPENGDAAPPEPFRGPPLRIAHFFVWTAITAVLVTLNAQEFTTRPVEFKAGTFERAISVLLNIRLAAGVIGLWALWRWRVPGMLVRLQAGHWLVIGLTAVGILTYGADLVATLIARASWAYPPSDLPQAFISAYDACVGFATAVWFAEAAFWLYALCHVSDDGPWHVVLWTQAFGGPAWGIFRVSERTASMPAAAAILLTALAVSYAVYSDRAHPLRRDWLHWLGVAILVVDTSESLLRLVETWLGNAAS